MKDNLTRHFDGLPTKAYRRRYPLYQANTPASQLYVVREGRVKLGAFSSEGEELIHEFVSGAKPVLIGLEALGSSPSYLTDATPIEPVRAQVIPVSDVQRMLNHNRKFGAELTEHLVERLNQRTLRTEQLHSLNLSARFARSLADLSTEWGMYANNTRGLPEVSGPSQDELAAFSSATRASCNKLLGRWEDNGYIKREGRDIIILKSDVIEDLANNLAPGTTAALRQQVLQYPRQHG